MKLVSLFFLVILAARPVGHSETQTVATALAGQVRETERAFAKTMVDRDHAAVVSFLADETVFLGDPQTFRHRRGRRSMEGVLRRHAGAVLVETRARGSPDSGTLALSSGPVRNPAGARVGTFKFRVAPHSRRQREDRVRQGMSEVRQPVRSGHRICARPGA